MEHKRAMLRSMTDAQVEHTRQLIAQVKSSPMAIIWLGVEQATVTEALTLCQEEQARRNHELREKLKAPP